MAKTQVPPKRLYKYRAFNELSLNMLIEDRIYFADPASFNDPLDAKPNLNTDLCVDEMREILSLLLDERINAEMKSAASVLKFGGPSISDRIAKITQRQKAQIFEDISYHASNPEYEGSDPTLRMLGYHVEEELLRRYDKGVFSAAERPNCPLMWSHYGDQHRGVCLGYSIPSASGLEIRKVEYGGSRLVSARDVQAMVRGDDDAKRRVDEAVLFRKARPWRYEREWRAVGPRGEQDSGLELEEVLFGMRCREPVKYAVIMALKYRGRKVKFYEIIERRGEFPLKKQVYDESELVHHFPRRSRDIYEMLEALDDLPDLPSGRIGD